MQSLSIVGVGVGRLADTMNRIVVRKHVCGRTINIGIAIIGKNKLRVMLPLVPREPFSPLLKEERYSGVDALIA